MKMWKITVPIITLLCLASCSFLYPIILVNQLDEHIVLDVTFKDIADTSNLRLTYIPSADLDNEYRFISLHDRRKENLPYQLIESDKIRVVIPADYTVNIISKINGFPDYFKECRILAKDKELVMDEETMKDMLKRKRIYDFIGLKKYLKINDAVFRQ
ncbi:hypothetical protein FXV77_16645 [Sphingobacterium phlebotomi]|uniref:Uncharacterized protein n=1 Tax=Sphingobacterium phlebotomi TaxID=2605433 RepID=A0A5D4H4Z1_9SPHI|nr:hypothetical protein [Sphingobacterium phlebotomi]TYR33870.1 hypothetical protein FXV77_16645 [Sphingobacterium phlebotomi]